MKLHIICITCEDSILERNILTCVSQALQEQAHQKYDIEHITEDFTPEIDLINYENRIIILTGCETADALNILHKQKDENQCIVWVASNQISEQTHNLISDKVDVIIQPKAERNHIESRHIRVFNTSWIPFDIHSEKLKNLSETNLCKETECQTQSMSQPKKSCWNLFFKPSKPTAVAAFLGGTHHTMMNYFTNTMAFSMAKKIKDHWPTCYVIAVSDTHTPPDSRQAFTQALERHKIPYILYDESNIETVLSFIALNRGEIVLTDDCLWKMSMACNIHYLDETCPPQKNSSIKNPLHPEEEEVVFELLPQNTQPEDHSHTEKHTEERIIPYILPSQNNQTANYIFRQNLIEKNLAHNLLKTTWRAPGKPHVPTLPKTDLANLLAFCSELLPVGQKNKP